MIEADRNHQSHHIMWVQQPFVTQITCYLPYMFCWVKTTPSFKLSSTKSHANAAILWIH